MGVPGVPLNIPKESIATAIKNNNGRMNKIALSLDIGITTARKYISQDAELMALLHDYRQHRDENLLEGAEDTLQKAFDRNDEDMSSALKATIFVLNNKGKSRGYTPPNSTVDDETKQNLSDLIKLAKSGELTQQ